MRTTVENHHKYFICSVNVHASLLYIRVYESSDICSALRSDQRVFSFSASLCRSNYQYTLV